MVVAFQPSHDLLDVETCYRSWATTRLFGLVEDVGQVAATAVLAVVHGSHEDTSTALGDRALTTSTGDLTVLVHLSLHENLG